MTRSSCVGPRARRDLRPTACAVARRRLGGSELGLALGAEYFRDLSARVSAGTSALFVLTTDPSMDEVANAYRGTTAELLATNLTQEQEERLLGEFGLTGATADALR